MSDFYVLENEHWRKAAFEALQSHKLMFDSLTATQARCTELLEENRALRAELATIKQGIVLPGFTCACGVFNGDEKERRTTCRSCDAPRPTVVSTT